MAVFKCFNSLLMRFSKVYPKACVGAFWRMCLGYPGDASRMLCNFTTKRNDGFKGVELKLHLVN
jgi:hypothetical protein